MEPILEVVCIRRRPMRPRCLRLTVTGCARGGTCASGLPPVFLFPSSPPHSFPLSSSSCPLLAAYLRLWSSSAPSSHPSPPGHHKSAEKHRPKRSWRRPRGSSSSSSSTPVPSRPVSSCLVGSPPPNRQCRKRLNTILNLLSTTYISSPSTPTKNALTPETRCTRLCYP